jgi:predicted amidohydrolase YtcJ
LGTRSRLTRDEALAILTKGAAYAAFQEQDRGTIEPGKLADFSVYSADWMQVPEAEIPHSQAVMTVIAGEIAWQAP